MSSTNINDPAGVSALLEQLKASTEWQQLTADPSRSQPEPPSSQQPSCAGETTNSTPIVADVDLNAGVNTSVASLLSQLKPLSVNARANQSSLSGHKHVNPPSRPNPRSVEEDRRKVSFREALPILSELADDAPFVAAVRKMKEDQDTLERNLWAEREDIYAKYHDKFKTAQTKAQMIGTTVSQYEIDVMTGAFKKEIVAFDRDRVMPAWDGLVSRQQQELERVKIPTMYPTSVPQDRQRQQQVMQVLETIVAPKP